MSMTFAIRSCFNQHLASLGVWGDRKPLTHPIVGTSLICEVQVGNLGVAFR
jgi:hypothetical protein